MSCCTSKHVHLIYLILPQKYCSRMPGYLVGKEKKLDRKFVEHPLQIVHKSGTHLISYRVVSGSLIRTGNHFHSLSFKANEKEKLGGLSFSQVCSNT